MSNTSTAEFQAVPMPPPASGQITLRHWPLWDEPLSAWPTLIVAAAVAAGAGAYFQLPWVAAALAAVFLITLWRVWVPVWFEIGPRGVVEVMFGRRRRIGWNSIETWRIERRGIFLSPFADSHLRSALRGVYIFCGARQPEAAASVEYYLRATSSFR